MRKFWSGKKSTRIHCFISKRIFHTTCVFKACPAGHAAGLQSDQQGYWASPCSGQMWAAAWKPGPGVLGTTAVNHSPLQWIIPIYVQSKAQKQPLKFPSAKVSESENLEQFMFLNVFSLYFSWGGCKTHWVDLQWKVHIFYSSVYSFPGTLFHLYLPGQWLEAK